MRLDEISDSCYKSPEFTDVDFDAQLEEIDTLYSEIDNLYLDEKKNNPIRIDLDRYPNRYPNKYTNRYPENHTDTIIFYTMFNVCVVIAVCSTIIKRQMYDNVSMILFKIIADQNNPTYHANYRYQSEHHQHHQHHLV